MSGINVIDTEIKGVKLVTPPPVFEDHRGVYRELWNFLDYDCRLGHVGIRDENGPSIWCADDISISRRNVLRGIHGDYKTYKLVSCLYGAFFLVVVDWREDSPTRYQYVGLTLSDRNYLSVLIPPGCGNGHLVLTDIAIFHYKQSELYDREGQFTIAWNDPTVGIRWPISTPILSERDASVLHNPTEPATDDKGKQALSGLSLINNLPWDASEAKGADGGQQTLFGLPVIYLDNPCPQKPGDSVLPTDSIPYKEGELFSEN